MLSSSLLAGTALISTATAHFHLLQPTWRGDSFAPGASQYNYPCANVNETTDRSNRTQWPVSGGSVVFNGSHPSALTYVNLALGRNASNFNISLVPAFNQTGPGVFCWHETGRANLEAGLKAAGYSGFSDKRLDGLDATVQVIQLGERGSALYNVSLLSMFGNETYTNGRIQCADVTFNSTAQLLPNDQCVNGTGVGGVAIANVQSNTSSSATPSGSAAPAKSSGAASSLGPVMGSGLFAAVLAWGLL